VRATAFLIVALVAIAALVASEHSRPNAGVPLVNAAATQSASKLFVPCPLAPRNLPLTGERTA
jgi:hypothetical protein